MPGEVAFAGAFYADYAISSNPSGALFFELISIWLPNNGNRQFTLKNSKITEDTLDALPSFPKYTTKLMNLANQNAQGTRPQIVGQMSELIHSAPKGVTRFG
jgi:hypothetical protein